MKKKIKPIFIISLPRAGSTLLQRILGYHDNIYTTSETWMLLPFLYILKKKGVYSEYWHRSTSVAFKDFIGEMPQGKKDYFESLREFVLDLYSKAAADEEFFLEKTPRYHLILTDLIKVFPDAKIIILVRHPIAILNSIIETWGEGAWNLFKYKIDLYVGLMNILSVYKENKSRFFLLNYENLIHDNKETIRNLEEYLGVRFPEESIANFSQVELKGKMGDPTGVKKYTNISDKSISSWMKPTNIIRKIYFARYVKWIGKENLSVIGYDHDQILDEIKQLPFSVKYVFRDVLYIFFGWGYCLFDFFSLYDKLKKVPNFKNIYFQK